MKEDRIIYLPRVLLIAFMAFFVSSSLSIATEQPDIEEIIDKIDRLFRSETSWSKFEMRIETPDWQRTLKMEGWTEGLDKTFIRILSPKKETGTSTLRIDNEMWNYFPKINKVMKVALNERKKKKNINAVTAKARITKSPISSMIF